MNLPNILSIARFFISIALVYFLLKEELLLNAVALFFFLIGCLTDYLDGFLARKQNIVTSFGKIIDPIADKVFIFSSFFTLAYLGHMPFWVVVIMFVREFMVTVTRFIFLKSGRVVAADFSGKIKTFSQCILISVIIIYIIAAHFYDGITFLLVASTVVDLLIFWTLLITILSGIDILLIKPLLKTRLYTLFAAIGGIGRLPKAPGTWGAVAALPFIAIIPSSDVILTLFTLTVVLGVFLCVTASSWLREKDPSWFVLDEFSGMLLSVLFLPISLVTVCFAFVLFRLFDIYKPAGIKRLDEISHPISIMLDDWLAGLYTNIILQILVYFLPIL